MCLSKVCIAGFVYSGQAQYHSVLVQCVLLVLCIRDRCNTILCRCLVYIAASNISRCRTGYVIIIIIRRRRTLFQEDYRFGTTASLTYGPQLQSYAIDN